MIKRQPALQDSHSHPLILSPIIRRLLYLQGSLSPLPPRRGAWLTGSPSRVPTSRRQWTVEPCCIRPRKGPPPPEGGPSSWYGYSVPRSIEDGVFSPGLVCLRYPGLDPRVCLGCPVFLNGDEIPGSSLLTGPLNPRAQSLITQSSIDRGNTTLYMQVNLHVSM